MQRLDRLPRITEQLSELWADNYDASVEREMQENDAMGMTQAAWLMQYVAPRSTYQLNNRQSAELATVREARDQRMRRKWAASARHANNQRDTPFSMLARSIGMLGRLWVAGCRARAGWKTSPSCQRPGPSTTSPF